MKYLFRVREDKDAVRNRRLETHRASPDMNTYTHLPSFIKAHATMRQRSPGCA